jgi:hypothetical protein
VDLLFLNAVERCLKLVIELLVALCKILVTAC